jgi:probable DNA repair protein
VVRGGASVFKHQAACPFRAFSVLRLGAVGLGQAQVGLGPQERGTLVHVALDVLWQRLRSHAELVALGEHALSVLVDEVAQTVVAQVAAEHRDLFTPAFARLEQRRLAELLQQWLVLEKARAPFTVLAREQAHTLGLGGLMVNARIDRIDQLADGRCVIIDYKTGIPSEADWFGPRPEEPQLPLYAVAVERPLAAVLFGQVVRGDARFRGVAAVDGVAPGVKPHDQHRYTRESASWEAMIAAWQSVLTRLAQDFRAGHAAVDPKDAATCQYCECAPLCRVYERNGVGPIATEGGDDE